MPKISKKRLDRYRQLADRGLWDVKDPDFRKFFERAAEEGVEMVSNNYNQLGMFRSPHKKDFKDVDIAMVGVPNPRPGTRLGPKEVRDFIRGLKGLNLVGADLMELSPPFDPTGQSSCLASGIAFEILCLLAEARATHSGTERKTHWK
ncbi:MAG: arginase family protein [Thermodesulfobacteriota bacterium]